MRRSLYRGHGRFSGLQRVEGAIFPPGCRALVLGAQRALNDFELGRLVPRKALQPVVPGCRVLNAIVVTESRGRPSLSIGRRRPSHQGHGNLRTESRAQPQRIAHRLVSSPGQVQSAQFGVHLLEVWDRRNDPGLEHFDRYDIFDTDSHRVACSAFGVGDQDLIRGFFENVPQGEHFRGSASSAGRGIGFVGNKNRFRRDLEAVNAPFRFGARNQLLHHVAYVADVEPRPMEGAVGHHGSQDLADRADAAFARSFLTFEHDS